MNQTNSEVRVSCRCATRTVLKRNNWFSAQNWSTLFLLYAFSACMAQRTLKQASEKISFLTWELKSVAATTIAKYPAFVNKRDDFVEGLVFLHVITIICWSICSKDHKSTLNTAGISWSMVSGTSGGAEPPLKEIDHPIPKVEFQWCSRYWQPTNSFRVLNTSVDQRVWQHE